MTKRIREHLIFGDSYLNVFRDEVELPSGKRGHFWRVVEPGDGACVVVRDQDDKTYLHRVFRYVLGEELWEIPRGAGRPGESPTETALREVNEEKTFKADILGAKELGYVYTNSSYIQAKLNVCLLTVNVLENDLPPRDEDEDILLGRWFDRLELTSLVTSGELVDGVTLAALTIAGRFGTNS